MALQKINRLRKKKEIQDAWSRAKAVSVRSFRLFYVPNGLPHPRFAFVVSKKVSKSAVLRNRIRRRASEWIREHLKDIKKEFDYILNFSPLSATISRKEYYEDIERAFLECNRRLG